MWPIASAMWPWELSCGGIKGKSGKVTRDFKRTPGILCYFSAVGTRPRCFRKRTAIITRIYSVEVHIFTIPKMLWLTLLRELSCLLIIGYRLVIWDNRLVPVTFANAFCTNWPLLASFVTLRTKGIFRDEKQCSQDRLEAADSYLALKASPKVPRWKKPTVFCPVRLAGPCLREALAPIMCISLVSLCVQSWPNGFICCSLQGHYYRHVYC